MDSYTLTKGTLVSGTVASTRALDGTDLVFAEVTGTPGWLIEFNFGQWENDAPTKLAYYGHYLGNVGHNVDVEIYNNNAGTWDAIGKMEHATSDALHEYSIGGNPYVYVNETTGVVKIRSNHTSPGNVNHRLFVDWMRLTTTI